jgi:hypothetical protein
MSAESKPGRFPDLLQVRCPSTLPPLIERAAQSRCMTPSEYMRRCFVDGLKADGIDPAQMAGAA